MPEPSARSRSCNVLFIGAGAAGLRAAIAATEAGSQVLVLGKRHRLDAHTVLAAGGINAGLGARDPPHAWAAVAPGAVGPALRRYPARGLFPRPSTRG